MELLGEGRVFVAGKHAEYRLYKAGSAEKHAASDDITLKQFLLQGLIRHPHAGSNPFVITWPFSHLMDACFVGDEQVQAQACGFYGGWISSNIVGPFNGDPGTHGW